MSVPFILRLLAQVEAGYGPGRLFYPSNAR